MYGIDISQRYTDIFDLGRFAKYSASAECYDIFNSKFLKELPKLPVAGEYVIQSESLAPDLVTYNMYSNENMYWIMLAYNGISNYQDIRPGVKLKFPSYLSIEKLFFSLKGER